MTTPPEEALQTGILGQAAAVIAAGHAERIVCYRAMNGFSGRGLRQPTDHAFGGLAQFMVPYGMGAAAETFGMPCRRHMFRYGTTKEQLGAVAVTTRSHARLNPRAIRRDPLTLEEYMAARPIAEPYSLYDCCQQSDGACAVVVCDEKYADEIPHPPVYLLGSVIGMGRGSLLPLHAWPDLSESYFPVLADRLYTLTGLSVADIDVALLYDAFTFEVIQQVEDFGFCPKGEGGPFVASGAIALDGTIPVNPHGGLLSEAYVHGFNHVVEAVQQLRNEGAERQVSNVDVALVTGFAYSSGSAMLLGGPATK